MSEVYKTLIADAEVNGIKIPVNVTIEVSEDDMPFDGDFPEDIARHKSGELFVANLCVRATALGIEGCDSLGGCSLRPNNMFNSESFETDVDTILSYYSMVENALTDLVANIQTQANLLNPFATERT